MQLLNVLDAKRFSFKTCSFITFEFHIVLIFKTAVCKTCQYKTCQLQTGLVMKRNIFLLQNVLVAKRNMIRNVQLENKTSPKKVLPRFEVGSLGWDLGALSTMLFLADDNSRSGGPFGLRPQPATRFRVSSPSSRLRHLISLAGFACCRFLYSSVGGDQRA